MDSSLLQPKVSVIIPNYNHSAHVVSAINAFVKQTLPPDEIIVVDDASTDDSAERIARVAEKHREVRLVQRRSNGGPNVAIMDGLAEASGTYVCAAAADDRVAREFLERSVAVLEANPKAALCFSDPGELIGDSGMVREHSLGVSATAAYFPPDELSRIMTLNMFSISSNTVVYRRELLIAVGGFRPDLSYHADWFANLVLGFRHGACYEPQVLAYFRVRPGSYSWSGARDLAGQRQLLHRVIDLLRTEYADIHERFRSSALIPEMRLRDVMWLLRSPSHRSYLTVRLAGRLLAREAWTHLRPLVPLTMRRRMRRVAGRLTSTDRRPAA